MCCFGLASFAEGADLLGPIANTWSSPRFRLPCRDDRSRRALAEWIEARGGNPFMEIAVPDASLRLVQACGRLLRTEQDRGTITLLDRRVVTQRYGKAISMPCRHSGGTSADRAGSRAAIAVHHGIGCRFPAGPRLQESPAIKHEGSDAQVQGYFDSLRSGSRCVCRIVRRHPATRRRTCVQIGGETVVDLWAGVADNQGEQAWHSDTLVNLFSRTKTFTAVAALQLVEEGKLELDAPVARVWPEFAANGKESITLRQLLCHRAGLPAIRRPLAPEALYD